LYILTEEAFLEKLHLPGLKDHRLRHKKFIADVRQLKLFAESNDLVSVRDFSEALVEELSWHIRTIDAGYTAPYGGPSHRPNDG